jgi:hypothetical protein
MTIASQDRKRFAISSAEVDIELHWSPNNLLISKSNTSKKIPDILLLGYKEAIRGRDIYSAKKDTNRGGELGMNHDDKLFIYR